MKTYASLHNHTDYSNVRGLDSINRVTDLIDTAISNGFSAVAITDHDSLSGHIKAMKHYDKIQPENFKLILGNEIYLTREHMTKENYVKGAPLYHFLLLSLNKEGHKQLRELSTRAWDRSFFNAVPRTPTYIDDLKEVVGTNPGNLVATTACIAGMPGTYFDAYGENATPQIREFLYEMESIFGKGNFYIEVQPSMLKKVIKYNQYLVKEFWGEFPFVFTTDSHYLTKEDSLIHKQFLLSANKSRDVDSYYNNNYLMSYDEIVNAMSYIDADKIEEMRLNTLKIAARVETYNLAHEQVVPRVPVEINPELQDVLKEIEKITEEHKDVKTDYIMKFVNSDDEQDIFFIAKVFAGLYELVENVELKMKSYLERLEYELEQIWETSEQIHQRLSAYFVTMAKMIDIIWEEGDSLVGVSRGSAAGFLVNYLLGITQIDPTNQVLELPAWRFIHKDRPGLPDIDIDTEGDKRSKVFTKVQEYLNSIGGDLINVCTFGTEKSKSSLRTAGRGLGIDDDVISYIVSMVPNSRGIDSTLTQCMYGDEEHQPVAKFQEEMAKYPELWNLASRIEGLITSIGVHASGVLALNTNVTEFNSVMRTSRGVKVTAFNLEDTEYAGGLKYDFLTINALDKIRTTLNLLLEDGMIEWHGSLRDTYNHYLLPKNLIYDDQDMWKMVHDGQIVDLFQFDTQVGSQAVRMIKPTNIAELSVANSVMRLMTDDTELPLNTYAKHKHNIDAWYQEMLNAGLTMEEMTLLEKYLLPLSGVADSQESAMLLVMDPEISGFSVTEANNLRRAIARKDPQVLLETREKFFHHGLERGARQELLDYIWNVQIMRQAGYSFSVLHTMGYSTIALQEMNLAYRFPIIYWNTASLSVNAGAINEEDYEALIEDGIVVIDEEDDNKKSGKVQYGKVAASIMKFRDELGVKIGLPDINRARFGFVPDAINNEIVFGLKGITKIGDKLINQIIENRPYNSLEHFLSVLNKDKTVVSKDRVVLLIKAGAFDRIENKPREQILYDFVKSIADQKKTLNLRNMKMLIKYGLVPDDLAAEVALYNFTDYIRKFRVGTEYYRLDDVAQSYFYENSFDFSQVEVRVENNQNISLLKTSYWDRVYNSSMDAVRAWLNKNQKEVLEQLNSILLKEELDKYATGSVASWEVESLGFYHGEHELKGVAETIPVDIEISNINEIPDLERDGFFHIKGKQIPKYKIRHIIGTVLDKDNAKKTIVFSTPDGVINVKFFQAHYTSLDKVIFEYDEFGNKVTIQDSFFKKGTFLLISGIKNGGVFMPKIYKNYGIESVIKFDIENGAYVKGYEKL